MAIDPNMLQSFAAPGEEEMMPDDAMMPAEGEAPTGPTPEEREKRLAHLVMMLGRVGEDMIEFVDEVDQEVLDDPMLPLAPEDVEAIEESVSMLGPATRKALDDVAPLDPADALFVAQELSSQEMIDKGDIDRLASWLIRASQHSAGTAPLEADEEDEEYADEMAEEAP